MLARLFVMLGGLLVFALCALLVAPFFVDWAGYRSAFEQEAGRLIGQPVRVEGAVSARILPFPSVTFSDVVIEGENGAPTARIAAFSMDAELAPFLSGELLIFDMRIEQPDVQLNLAENGTLIWALPQTGLLEGTRVALESVNISDGRVTIARGGHTPLLFDDVSGKVSAKDLNGPWLAEGRFAHGKDIYDARLSTGAQQDGESLRVRLSLAPLGGFYEAAFDGRIEVKNDASLYGGKLEMSLLGQTIESGGKRQRLADLAGGFSIDAGGIKMTEAVLTAGPADRPYRANGSLGLSFGDNARFDISLKGQQIHFGDLEGSAKADRVSYGVPLADRLAALQAVLVQLPLPQIPGRVDLALPVVVVGDSIFRNAEMTAAPAKTGWQIERYSVELPGRTLLEGAGTLSLAEGFGFDGQVTLASRQPPGFAKWLGLKAGSTLGALPNAGLSARVNFDAQRQTLRDVEFRAGAAVLRGLIDRQVPQDGRARTTVQLTGEGADLEWPAALAGLGNAENTGILGDDFDLAFKSAPVSGFGLQAGQLDAGLRLTDGRLEIAQFDITDLAGADVSLSGALSNVMTGNPAGQLDVAVAALDPLPLIEALGMPFQADTAVATGLKAIAARAGLMGTALADANLSAKFTLSGKGAANEGIKADYRFEGAGLRFGGLLAARDLTSDLSGPNINLSANGIADRGETFLAGLGLPVGDERLGLQNLAPVGFDVSLVAKAGLIDSGSLKATSNQDVFETGFGPGPNTFRISAADFAPYAMAGGFGLPDAAYGVPLSAKGQWERAGGAFHLRQFEGTLADVPVSGQLTLETSMLKADARPKLTGQIKAGAFDRSVLDEIVLGPLAAGGDEKAAFSAALSLSFDADVLLAVDQATGFAPLPLQQAAVRLSVDQDTIRLADIKAGFADGQLTGTGEARKNGPEVFIRLNAALLDVDLSKLKTGGMAGKGDLQFEISAAGANFEMLRASMAGSGVASVKGAVLNGISTGGFASLVAEADARNGAPDEVLPDEVLSEGIGPDDIALLEMSERHIMTGQMALPPFQTAFTIASGMARAPRSLLQVEGGALSFEPKLDLNTGKAVMTAQVQFDSGIDAGIDAGADVMTGANPALNLELNGQWSDLVLKLDPQPLQGFLSQRALAKEEMRVEAFQSAVLEKQRLRRENRYFTGLAEARAKARNERIAAEVPLSEPILPELSLPEQAPLPPFVQP
jgi:uncharacterized protein involved in outer membrane biogenesis